MNGVESPVGAAAYSLHGGEAIWWDYRDWSAAMQAPAVVGSWPEPFTGGYEGKRHPAAVECMGGGGAVGRCEQAGGRGRARRGGLAERCDPGAGRSWAQVRADPAAAQIEAGPQTSGVFARFSRRGGGFALTGLGEDGKAARLFGATAGLVAATRRYEAPPTWIVTGASLSGVRAAAGLLDPADLRDHYAVATEAGKETPLPAMR